MKRIINRWNWNRNRLNTSSIWKRGRGGFASQPSPVRICEGYIWFYVDIFFVYMILFWLTAVWLPEWVKIHWLISVLIWLFIWLICWLFAKPSINRSCLALGSQGKGSEKGRVCVESEGRGKGGGKRHTYANYRITYDSQPNPLSWRWRALKSSSNASDSTNRDLRWIHQRRMYSWTASE